MSKLSEFAVKTDKDEFKTCYDVQIYHGKTFLGMVTVTAESAQDASNVAIKDMNVKIKRAWN
jgi:hypothetical protein